MDVFEAHKYLDPTTFDDSPFISFSSFADLTQATSDCLTLSSSSSSPVAYGKYSSFCAPSHSQPHSPPASLSHSDSPSPSSPFNSVFLTTPSTPAVARYADLGHASFLSTSNQYASAPPPKHAGTSTSNHVKHRSTSSTSDWNSPVTPSLTSKSSVDSFNYDTDFFLPPTSTHSASVPFGWDDQYLYGGTNSSGSEPSLPTRSPPSPSPYRVASNPQLGATAHRHPRSVKHVMSMPSIGENLVDTQGAVGLGGFDASDFLEDTFSEELQNVSFEDNAWTQFIDLNGYSDGAANTNETPKSTEDASHGSFASDLNGCGPDFYAMLDNSTPPLGQLGFVGTTPPTLESGSNLSAPPSSSVASTSTPSISPELLTNVSLPMTSSAPSLVPDLSSASTILSYEAGSEVLGQYRAWRLDQTPGDSNLVGLSGFPVDPSAYTSALVPKDRPLTDGAPYGMPRQASGSGGSLVPPTYMQRSASVSGVPNYGNYYSGLPEAAPASRPSTTQAWQTYGLHPSPEIFEPQQGFTSRRSEYPSSNPVSTPRFADNSNGFQATYTDGPSRGSVNMGRTHTAPGMSTYQQSRDVAHTRIASSSKVSNIQSRNPLETPLSTFPVNYTGSDFYWTPEQTTPMSAQQSMPLSGTSWSTPVSYSAPPTSAGPTHGSGSGLMTNTPLLNIHPPPNGSVPNPHSRMVSSSAHIQPQPHIVHPPPQPLQPLAQQSQARPIARMPSGGPGRRQRVVTGASSTSTASTATATAASKPKAPRAANGPRKKAVPSGGVNMWGENTFVNYTPADGKKLLSGVAPSGSQNKRKRELDAAAAALAAGQGHLSVPMLYTASSSSIDSNDDRSKRSKSSDSR